MRGYLFLLVCCTLYWADAATVGRTRYDGHKVFSVTINSEEEADVLVTMHDSIDVWSGIRRNKPTDVHVRPEQVAEFTSMLSLHGIHFVETVPDLQKLVANEEASLGDPRVKGTFANHYTPEYKEVQVWMKNIANMYEFAEVSYFGTTYEGREIELLILGANRTADKPILFVEFGMHAREWMTVACSIWITEEITASYGIDMEITALLDKYDLYILPVYNPDGYQYSHDKERFWRKNRAPNNDSRCFGTDLNRNFDYPKFGGPGTSSDPCSDTYKGHEAFSAIESQHLRSFLEKNKDRVVMYHNTHAYSQMWFTPWGYTQNRPEDGKELDAIAQVGADALYGVHKTVFEVGPPSHLLYAAGGASMDWVKGVMDVKYASAMELRPERGSGYAGFIVDPDDVEPSGQELLAGFLAVFAEIDRALSS